MLSLPPRSALAAWWRLPCVLFPRLFQGEVCLLFLPPRMLGNGNAVHAEDSEGDVLHRDPNRHSNPSGLGVRGLKTAWVCP